MLVDILIFGGCILAVYRGAKTGFVRQLFSTGGFLGGLMLGVWIEPHMINVVHGAQARSALTLFVILGTGFMLLMIGEYAGIQLKFRLMPKRLHLPDSGLGGLTGMVSLLLAVWLGASIINNSAAPELQRTIRSSDIINALNRTLPPAPGLIAKLGAIIDPNGFPDVFIGNEPVPRTPVNLPSLGELAGAVNADRDSVVRIRGQGCGGIVSGSGFIVRPGIVATNAHVVAGIPHPYVQDGSGSHRTTAIWFDYNLDFALLKVDGLSGRSLHLDGREAGRDTPVAVLGYPGGGNFSAKAGVVLDQIRAAGRNIYGGGHTERDVYELHTDIVPGNSGGPLVDKAGDVIGIVFAESTAYNHVGYALVSDHLDRTISGAVAADHTTGTGPCAE